MSINYCYDIIINNTMMQEQLQSCVEKTYTELQNEDDNMLKSFYITLSVVICLALCACCKVVNNDY